MNRHIRIGIVTEKRLFNKISGLIADEARGSLLTSYKSVSDLMHSSVAPDLAIVRFESVNRSREILSDSLSRKTVLPVIFIYPESSISIPDFKDLVINGAFGMVPDTNLKSLIQHIHRFQKGEVTIAQNPDFSEHFESFFNRSESIVSIINSDFKYESVNDRFREFHQLDNRNLRGVCPSHLWGEEVFRERIKNNLQKCLKGEVIRYKAFFDREGLDGKCYEVIYRPIKPKGASDIYTLVETRDVTGTEEALRIAGEAMGRNHYYERFLPFGIFECNREGIILSANETFYNILEIPEGSREGIKLSDFAGSDRRLSGYLMNAHAGESTTFSQLPMTTHAHNEIFTRISSHSRLNKDGEIVINASLEDNTREVLLERKLNQTHRIETLGTLAGGIAHDFNTILTTITGYSELTMDDVDPDSSAYDYQAKLLHSVKRAEDIVNQMLTFSKQIDVELVPVVVEKVLDEVCDFMESAIHQGMVMERNIEPVYGVTRADPTQLFRVFLNIMNNAIQAMEEGRGRLRVSSTDYVRGKRRFAEIEISDTGKGIDKAIIDRIYEPFFSTRKPGEGTGMGLAVVHGIITGMGGEIDVESTPGKGTTFRIRIPVYDRDEISENQEKEMFEEEVIYADSNIHFSRTVALALENSGYKVRLATSAYDLESMMSNPAMLSDIIFLRCNFESDIKDKLIEKIVTENPDTRLVLITDPKSIAYRKFLSKDLKSITILNEPVNLRDIISTIQNK